MPLGDRARVLEVNVRVVERRPRVPDSRDHTGDRPLREKRDRRGERGPEESGALERSPADCASVLARGGNGESIGRIARAHRPTLADAVGLVKRPIALEAARAWGYLVPRPMSRLYDDAPRLPEGDRVDVRSLASGAWIEIEVGPGRGWFLVERAQAEPRVALVGLEVRRKWAAIVDERLAARGLASRARVFAEDARSALPRLVPDSSVRRLFLNFPDPWWKKRHEKRLLVKAGFLGDVARLLETGGELFVQTDVEERALAYAALVADDVRFKPAGDTPGTALLADHAYVARSPRERRAIADGLPVYRMRWRV